MINYNSSISICGYVCRENEKPVIAVAKDEAFCFYYQDNLIMLQERGARIKYFSPLHDSKLPDDCDALLIGGGYPELYAGKLSENIAMHNEIKRSMEKAV